MIFSVTPHTCVIPERLRESRFSSQTKRRVWIPTFVGMTEESEDKGKSGKCEGYFFQSVKISFPKSPLAGCVVGERFLQLFGIKIRPKFLREIKL